MKTELKTNVAMAMGTMLAGTCSAQTIISGPTISGGTWSLSGSPYYITGNSTLNSGQTLTIQPGVVVDIAEGVSIHARREKANAYPLV